MVSTYPPTYNAFTISSIITSDIIPSLLFRGNKYITHIALEEDFIKKVLIPKTIPSSIELSTHNF